MTEEKTETSISVKNANSEDDVSNFNSFGIERLTKEQVPKKIPADAIGLISKDVADKYKMIGFGKNDDIVDVAIIDPQDVDALNVLRFIAEKERVGTKLYQVSQEIFEMLFEFYQGPSEAVKEAFKSFKSDILIEENLDDSQNKDRRRDVVLKEAPVSKLLQVIIGHAIEGRASDIHIEPMDKDYRVRFRVDGILHVSLILPIEIGPVIISRVKILSNLKIDEKRKPQDGRFHLTYEKKEYDFRVSTLPVIEGEKVVLRILDKEEGITDIETLGMMGTAADNMLKTLKETYGMVLFTGPTGSGKSTTLYSLLKIINQDERNIVTLEDPIEYHIDGLNQSQINPDIGYTFSNGLRTILRQDPNIIMVGEIRDSETAELAVHAALTGHLMFSTLHTNTAIGAISRLIDMGIDAFLMAPALRIVASQRLVRKICSHCREEVKVPEALKEKLLHTIENVSDSEFKKYGLVWGQEIKAYRGKGCDECNGTGMEGRVAIFEVVPIDEDIRELIIEKKGNENLISKIRDERGFLNIKQDGVLKVLKGMTTIEEIERVTEGDINLTEEDI